MLLHFLYVANTTIDINNSFLFTKHLGVEYKTPWCAGWLNYVLVASGQSGTNSLLARSYLKKGIKIESYIKAKKGDIVILRRGVKSWQGHVGIFLGYSNNLKYVILLGGGQSKKVSIRNFKVNNILGIRRL